MNTPEFRRGVQASHALFRDLNLVSIAKWFGSLDVSPAFRAAALDPIATYVDVYRLGLHNRDYNMLLTDFSFVQFYFDHDKSPFGLRYAYYPNPYDQTVLNDAIEAGLTGSEGDDFDFAVSLFDEAQLDPRAPCVRYEVAFNDYRELTHPAAHFHFGAHGDSRWPAERILTPDAFALIIAKYFYASAWAKHGDRPDSMNVFDARLCAARLRCAALEPRYFSTDERRQFFFA